MSFFHVYTMSRFHFAILPCRIAGIEIPDYSSTLQFLHVAVYSIRDSSMFPFLLVATLCGFIPSQRFHRFPNRDSMSWLWNVFAASCRNILSRFSKMQFHVAFLQLKTNSIFLNVAIPFRMPIMMIGDDCSDSKARFFHVAIPSCRDYVSLSRFRVAIPLKCRDFMSLFVAIQNCRDLPFHESFMLPGQKFHVAISPCPPPDFSISRFRFHVVISSYDSCISRLHIAIPRFEFCAQNFISRFFRVAIFFMPKLLLITSTHVSILSFCDSMSSSRLQHDVTNLCRDSVFRFLHVAIPCPYISNFVPFHMKPNHAENVRHLEASCIGYDAHCIVPSNRAGRQGRTLTSCRRPPPGSSGARTLPA
jgi:hypothetical protein